MAKRGIMIEVFIGTNIYVFRNKKSALKFMYMMFHKGYIISGWRCEDPYDNKWLNERFKQ